jgi:predicted PurR-regulated permease PerM
MSRSGDDGVGSDLGRITGQSSDIIGTRLPHLLTIGVIVAILYLGQGILLPVACALLLTFALSPIVSFLRRRSVPKVAAVALTVAAAFVAITFFIVLLAGQVVSLAENIPTYQQNIVEKVRSLRDMGASGGLVERITEAIERVGAELTGRGEQSPAAPATEPEPKPLPVEIVDSYSAIEMLNQLIVPLVSPFATGGLIIVVVIFMLLERESIRDRFIRLVGYNDLHRTTEALQDAGNRVGQYLLMQLVVNTCYAIPIAIGLWILGIPNPVLWGLTALVLRFVPYIGPAIGMLMPLMLTLAVTPGWAPLLWTAGLFLVMELVTNNILEPWLYGSRTGLSSLSIIVSAIFWAWLWGPLGLVLSTPLTVCLVVLGRHVPQFEYLSVLFGDDPVLDPPARLYQRLLANDPDEGADHAEAFLEDANLVDFYDEVGVPALMLAEWDRRRGVMSSPRIDGVAAAALELVDDLSEFADDDDDEPEERVPGDVTGSERTEAATVLPDGEGRTLVCAGGRWPIDDAVAAMAAQVMAAQDAMATSVSFRQIEPGQLARLPLENVETVIVTYLSPQPLNHARYVVQRLKRARLGVRVGLHLPALAGDMSTEDVIARTNADFIASSIAQAAISALAVPEKVRPALRLKARRRPAKATKKAA